jgi:hypothetical protein
MWHILSMVAYFCNASTQELEDYTARPCLKNKQTNKQTKQQEKEKVAYMYNEVLFATKKNEILSLATKLMQQTDIT